MKRQPTDNNLMTPQRERNLNKVRRRDREVLESKHGGKLCLTLPEDAATAATGWSESLLIPKDTMTYNCLLSRSFSFLYLLLY